jgi:hypothetical protein
MNIEKELTANRPSDGIPELHDMPIGLVNAFLYQSDLQSSTSHHFLNQVEMEEPITLRQMKK